ncbi:MAG: FecR family protein [Steroidobacteraceae bacterium]
MSEATDIEERAAAWIARCDACGSAVDADLAAWLLEDPRHRAAYLRLAEAWARTERLGRLRPPDAEPDPDLLAPTHASSTRMRAPIRPRLRRQAAGALAVAAAAAGLLIWWNFSVRGAAEVLRTGPNALSRVMLSDGTVVTLNADTELLVRFNRAARTVVLVRGEAQFKVVHNSRWPFQVSADERTVRDVGTVFDVRREDARTVQIFVRRGRVAVLPAAGTSSASGYGSPVLWAGDEAVLTAHHVVVRHGAAREIARQLHWLRRRLNFRGETLGQAVAEFNRSNYCKIIITDPTLMRLRIGGTFRILAVHSFVAALGHSFNIRALPGPRHTILLYPSGTQ